MLCYYQGVFHDELILTVGVFAQRELQEQKKVGRWIDLTADNPDHIQKAKAAMEKEDREEAERKKKAEASKMLQKRDALDDTVVCHWAFLLPETLNIMMVLWIWWQCSSLSTSAMRRCRSSSAYLLPKHLCHTSDYWNCQMMTMLYYQMRL